MKICSKCKIEKDESEFYKDSRRKDGLYSSCKECKLLYRKTDTYKKYQIIFRKKYRKTEKFKRYRNEYNRGYSKEYRSSSENVLLKYKCRQKTNKLIAKGVINRINCQVCGELKVEAHHEDYNKPTEVIFLCRKCHLSLHNLNKTICTKINNQVL